MTSISGLSSMTSAQATHRPPPRGGQDPMAAVADRLGLNSDDLKNQLSSGKSLDDVATAQGVSHDDLITAIKAGMPSDATQRAGGVDATQIAEQIAGTKGMPPPPPGGAHGPGGPGGHGAPGGLKGANAAITDSSKLDLLSQLLEMDSEEVTSAATSATDLVQLLKDKGVDLAALKSVLDNGDLVDVSA